MYSWEPRGWSLTYTLLLLLSLDHQVSYLFSSFFTAGPIGMSPLMTVPHKLPVTCQEQQVLTPNRLYYLDPLPDPLASGEVP